jgi:hypothetical protein
VKKLRDEFGGGTVKGRRLEEGGRAGIRTDERFERKPPAEGFLARRREQRKEEDKACASGF